MKQAPLLHGSFLSPEDTGIVGRSPSNNKNSNNSSNNSVLTIPRTPNSSGIMRSDPVNIANSYHNYMSYHGSINSSGVERESAVNTTPGLSTRVLPSYIGSNGSVGSFDIQSDGHSSQSQIDSDDGSSLDLDGDSHHYSNSSSYCNGITSPYTISGKP